jgi:nucleotide-binding universal stress UspA family protein
VKILIAADYSSYTKRVLTYLAVHKERLVPNHHYSVVHSLLAVPDRAAAFVEAEVVRKFHDDDAGAVFQPIRAFFKHQGIEATFVHPAGHAPDSIANLAEEGKLDLLVMGSRDHIDLVNLGLGSVATKVLAKCATPALLVR